MDHAWKMRGNFAGNLFLDFANTVNDEGKTRERNALPDWATALEWAEANALLSTSEARELANLPPADARSELDRLLAFREAAWSELSRAAGSVPPDADVLEHLGRAVQWSLSKARLTRHDRTFWWSADVETHGAALMRVRLVHAFRCLAAGDELSRLRECGRCTGLFLDHGRGSGRRWCRMEVCGNRAKLERFRKRD